MSPPPEPPILDEYQLAISLLELEDQTFSSLLEGLRNIYGIMDLPVNIEEFFDINIKFFGKDFKVDETSKVILARIIKSEVFEISPKTFIAKGGEGEIHALTNDVALKVLRYADPSGKIAPPEVDIAKMDLTHSMTPSCVFRLPFKELHSKKLVEVTRLILAMPKAHSDLRNYLKATPKTMRVKARVFKSMVAATKELHDGGKIHRDIKLENFLVTNEKVRRIVLNDFGFAMNKGDKVPHDLPTGTYVLCSESKVARYAQLADEERKSIFESQLPLLANENIDVWSLGTCLLELLDLHPLEMANGTPPLESVTTETFQSIALNKVSYQMAKKSCLEGVMNGLKPLMYYQAVDRRVTKNDLYDYLTAFLKMDWRNTNWLTGVLTKLLSASNIQDVKNTLTFDDLHIAWGLLKSKTGDWPCRVKRFLMICMVKYRTLEYPEAMEIVQKTLGGNGQGHFSMKDLEKSAAQWIQKMEHVAAGIMEP